MKTRVLISGLIISGIAKAQLLDEGNVTLYLDLQPVLQLNVQGPSEITFTFDQIYKYYGGIIKYGATILKVSSTVTWDLWAAGISSGTNGCANPAYCWDVMMQYNVTSSPNAVTNVPITAVELHQFPNNPSTRSTGVPGAQGGFSTTCNNVVPAPNSASDYSSPFSQYDPTTNTFPNQVNNALYAPGSNIYSTPTSSSTASSSEKYIAGASNPASNANGDCGIPGGSYLAAQTALPNANSLFYYVIDYRILPGLPVRFPAHLSANVINGNAGYITTAETSAGYAANFQQFAAPGVYSMNVKYVLAGDQ